MIVCQISQRIDGVAIAGKFMTVIFICDTEKKRNNEKKQNFQDVKNKHRVHYLFGHRFVVCKHIPVERQNKLK